MRSVDQCGALLCGDDDEEQIREIKVVDTKRLKPGYDSDCSQRERGESNRAPTGFDTILQRYIDFCDGITDSGSNVDNPKPAEVEPVHRSLLTTTDVADYLNVTCRTVWDLSGKGDIQSVKVGGQLRFKREWIDEFIAAQTRNGNGNGSD